MNTKQLYRVRKVEMESTENGQFAALTFTPVADASAPATPGNSDVALALRPGMGGGGDAARAQEHRMTGIPVAELDAVGLDSVGTFTFTPYK